MLTFDFFFFYACDLTCDQLKFISETYCFILWQIPLTGPQSIIGRAVVVHADPDDLGKGNRSKFCVCLSCLLLLYLVLPMLGKLPNKWLTS